MDIDFESLWKVVAAPFSRHLTQLHGPEHWQRVEHNGLILAERTGATPDIVRLFAIFHDSRRMNDGYDPGHGARGAEFASVHRGDTFELPDEDFELLEYACIWHTDGTHHDNITADRLDLGRVGIIPDPKRMCTDFGREIAAAGDVERFLERKSWG
jgi:uncharacterized protein